MHYDSFCRFDFTTEMSKIRAYRNANVPFVIINMPTVKEVQKKWSDLDYLNRQLGPFVPYVADTSYNNHFMYAKVSSIHYFNIAAFS